MDAKRLVMVIPLVLLVAACGGGSHNTDPRKGRVVMRDTNCLWSSCEHDWKACAGPDLIVHYTGGGTHTIKGSSECAR